MIQQHIPKDPFAVDVTDKSVWDLDKARRLTIDLPEAEAFYKFTNQPKPEGYEPLTREDYLGHKWFAGMNGGEIRTDKAWQSHVNELFGPEAAPVPAPGMQRAL